MEKNYGRLKEKTSRILSQIKEVIFGDSGKKGVKADTVVAEDFRDRVERIKSRMDANRLSKATQKSISDIEKESILQMEKYRDQLTIMSKRNSYSKSNLDATLCDERRSHEQHSAKAWA